jgi:hypothetical protein
MILNGAYQTSAEDLIRIRATNEESDYQCLPSQPNHLPYGSAPPT